MQTVWDSAMVLCIMQAMTKGHYSCGIGFRSLFMFENWFGCSLVYSFIYLSSFIYTFYTIQMTIKLTNIINKAPSRVVMMPMAFSSTPPLFPKYYLPSSIMWVSYLQVGSTCIPPMMAMMTPVHFFATRL